MRETLTIAGIAVGVMLLLEHIVSNIGWIILCSILFMGYQKISGKSDLNVIMDNFDRSKVTIERILFTGEDDILVTIRNNSEARIYDAFVTCRSPSDHTLEHNSRYGYDYVYPHETWTIKMMMGRQDYDYGCVLDYKYEKTDLLRDH